MKKRKYDFAGWVTKNDIVCSDGVTIKHDAFRDNDGQKVPLVWNHDYGTPANVLGHVVLKHSEQGVYGFGYFNDTDDAISAKKLVQHGDISSMSMGARKIKRRGNDVVSGSIYEVSLVLAAANPGALIDSIVTHSENGSDEEKAIIYTGSLIHSSDDIFEEDSLEHKDKDKTIGDIIDTMNEEQKEALYAIVGMTAIDEEDEEGENKEEKNPDENKEEKEDEKGDEEDMKHNVFNKAGTGKNEEQIKHGLEDVLRQSQANKVSSLKDMIASAEIKGTDGEVLTHGINSIEMLFPEAYNSTNGNVPLLFRDTNTAYKDILDSVTKSPFSRVKTLVADLTEDEARAKGYIKGNMKKEEFFSLIKRVTQPTTVYKKQKLDRDDIIDITDFDVVAFMNAEMKYMLQEEIARAVLVGDGRDFSDEDKIDEQNIRPVISDNEFFTIHKSFADSSKFIEAVVKAMSEYRGSGRPSMYIDPTLLADVKLLKANDGRFLFGDIPSDEAVANRLGLKEIVPTTFMTGKGALIVNLSDYTLGSTKGGELTNFDDFDIDFNQYKYLIETRLSGALTLPKSAIHLQEGATAGQGADNEKGGLTYGKRGKPTTPAEPEE